MEDQRKRKELIWIIAVTIIVTVLHHEAAKVIGKVITDTYLQAFLGELFFAMLVWRLYLHLRKQRYSKATQGF